jgi:beta-glucanase (GH16 family)
MHSTLIKSAAVLLAAAVPMVSAQTSTTCNPLDKTCPDDPAMGATLSSDFTAGASDDWKVTNGVINYNGQGAGFTVAKHGDSPTIQTKEYFFFGTVEVKMQAAPGTGIVSSIVLESDDLDEIDWEALGGETSTIETNYFGKGNTATYDRATYPNVASPQTQSYTYTIDWQKDAITWSVNGNVVRTLTAAAAGDYFPQTPMTLRIGIWAGGDPSEPEGTIEWAGGVTDFTKGPFTMYIESVTIKNANPGSSYTYGDNSGSADSIKVSGGGSSDTTTTSAVHTTTTVPHTTTSVHTSTTEPATTTKVTTTTSVGSTGTGTGTGTGTPTGTATGTATAPGGGSTGGSTSTFTTATTTPSSTAVPGGPTTPGASGTPTSSTAPAPTNGAVSGISASGSVVALYGFVAAMVAYVL